ncbi:GSCOCG00005175001-RA-CDS [Cotesia congregata]|nr:GSCOCG00005175001-RA-CDS [Cotesia congregata]
MFCGKICVYLFVFFYSINFTLQVTSLNYYTGVVVEYHPIVEGKNTTVIAEENAKNFIKFLHTAKENQVDIIVFPENGLFSGQSRPPIYRRSFFLPHSTYLPDYKKSKVLCNDSASSVMEVLLRCI